MKTIIRKEDKEQLINSIDFTESEYNKMDTNATFDEFIDQIISDCDESGGTLEDAVFIGNDAFSNLKEKKTYKIFASGGFHNSKETYVIVSQKAYNAFDDVERGLISSSEWIENYLSDNQKKRLENHFCGIKGCTCGSYTRADFYKK